MVDRRVRRRLLQGVAGLIATVAAASPLGLRRTARAQPGGGLSVTRPAQGLAVIAGAGANVLVADGGDELLVVDGGHERHADILLARIAAEFPNRPIRTLINSHWHPDYTGLNVPLGSRGATIVAHENTRLWLGTHVDRWSGGSAHPPLPHEARPNRTFYRNDEVRVGDRRVPLGYLLQAHTDGDVYAHFTDANVIAVGGVIAADRWPLIDWWTGGWFGGLIDALDVLIELSDDGTRIVPGYGLPLTRADLIAQRAMFEMIYDRLLDLFVAARDQDEAVAAEPAGGFDVPWGDPEPFVRHAFESIGVYLTPDV